MLKKTNVFELKSYEPFVLGLIKLPIKFLYLIFLLFGRSFFYTKHYFEIKMKKTGHFLVDESTRRKEGNLILIDWNESKCRCGMEFNDTLEKTALSIVEDL